MVPQMFLPLFLETRSATDERHGFAAGAEPENHAEHRIRHATG